MLCDLYYPPLHPSTFEFSVHFQNYPTELPIPFRASILFCSNYLNQLKAALSIRDKAGYQNFNKLSKDQILRLQAVASGSSLESPSEIWPLEIIDNFVISGQSQSLVPFKLHVFRSTKLYTLLSASNLSQTVGAVVSEYLGAHLAIIACHGIQIPLETPMEWLAVNALCLDGFVHLTIP